MMTSIPRVCEKCLYCRETIGKMKQQMKDNVFSHPLHTMGMTKSLILYELLKMNVFIADGW